MKEIEAFIMLPICFGFWKQEHNERNQGEKIMGLGGVRATEPSALASSGRKTAARPAWEEARIPRTAAQAGLNPIASGGEGGPLEGLPGYLPA